MPAEARRSGAGPWGLLQGMLSQWSRSFAPLPPPLYPSLTSEQRGAEWGERRGVVHNEARELAASEWLSADVFVVLAMAFGLFLGSSVAAATPAHSPTPGCWQSQCGGNGPFYES